MEETITPEISLEVTTTSDTSSAERLDQVSRAPHAPQAPRNSGSPRLCNEDGTFMEPDAQEFFLTLVEKNKAALGLVPAAAYDDAVQKATAATRLAAEIQAEHKDTLAQFKAFVDSTGREVAALKAEIALLSAADTTPVAPVAPTAPVAPEVPETPVAPEAPVPPVGPAVRWATPEARAREARELIARLHAHGMAFGASYHFVPCQGDRTLAKCANGVEVHVYADHAHLWVPAKANAPATVESAIAQLEFATPTATAFKSGVKVVLAY